MIICTYKPGQLGNRLFLFAQLIAFCLEKDVPLANPAFDEYATYFNSMRNSVLCTVPVKRGKKILFSNYLRRIAYYFFAFSIKILLKIKLSNKFLSALEIDNQEDYYHLEQDKILYKYKRGLILIRGWNFLASNYLPKHKNHVISLFEPIEIYKTNINKLMVEARMDADLLIGVHIRHGDYKDFKGGKYLYNEQQYLSVIKKIESLFSSKSIKFLICSNGQLNYEHFKNIIYIKGNNHIIEDMYSFAQCDYIVGPPSTYTMWASFYGNVPLYMMENIDSDIKVSDFKITEY